MTVAAAVWVVYAVFSTLLDYARSEPDANEKESDDEAARAVLHAYSDPLLAALLNPVHAAYPTRRMIMETSDYEAAIAVLHSDCEQAIARIISHIEIVHVPVDGSVLDLIDAVREIKSQADPCTLGYVKENATLLDIWGRSSGKEFRLKVYKA
jgi:hypothetical protein